MKEIQTFLKKHSKQFFFLLLLVLVAHMGYRIFQYKEEYLTKYDPKYWEDRFFRSQWIPPKNCGEVDPHINPQSCVWDDAWFEKQGKFRTDIKKRESIGDDGLYAYSAWEYVRGKDPTLLNAEMPPLGKYFIGLSILVFQNQNIFALISGIVALLSFFVLNRIIFKSNTLAILPVFAFSFEPLFYTQLRAPFLDLLYLAFLCFIFYFILKKNFILSCIFLGLMMGTKASLATLILVASSVIVYFIFSKEYRNARTFILCLPISILVFTTSYLRFFLLGNGIFEFLKVQKWIVNFYSEGARGSMLSFWEMVFLGKWQTWFGQGAVVEEWQITWPILSLGFLIFFIILIRKKVKGEIIVIGVWCVEYLLFMHIVPLFPRYLLVVLPFFYTAVAWVVLRRNFLALTQK